MSIPSFRRDWHVSVSLEGSRCHQASCSPEFRRQSVSVSAAASSTQPLPIDSVAPFSLQKDSRPKTFAVSRSFLVFLFRLVFYSLQTEQLETRRSHHTELWLTLSNNAVWTISSTSDPLPLLCKNENRSEINQTNQRTRLASTISSPSSTARCVRW